MVHVVVGFLYGFNYIVPDDEPAATFHARVYSAGDYFQLPHLKKSAVDNFCDIAHAEPKNLEQAVSCLQAAPEIYSGTPESDKRLRNVVITTTKRHIYGLLLADNKHAELIKSIPSFALDLLQSRVAAPRTSVGWDIQHSLKCSSCSVRFGLVKPTAESTLKCPACWKEDTVENLMNAFKNAHGPENMTTCWGKKQASKSGTK